MLVQCFIYTGLWRVAYRVLTYFGEPRNTIAYIVRSAGGGDAYIHEVNPAGDTWALTSDSGLEKQAEFGFDHYAQFGSLNRIADRSSEIVREFAC